MAVICKHFGVCGGCQSQDVPYPEQRARKRRVVQELLWHSAGLQRPAVEPVIGMPAGEDGMPRHFRHKAAFVFAPKDARGRGLVMGHYAFRSRRVVPVAECPVQSVRANALAFALRDHLSRAQVTAAGPRLEGILRHVVIRTTHDDREALVLLVVTRNDKSLRKPLRAFLAWEGRPDGLFVTVHDRDDPYMVGDVVLRIDGRTHIRETRLGPTYLLSPTAFFQTNPDAAAAMVESRLVEQRKADAIPDQLLFLEHPPVITLGVRSRHERSNVLETPAGLAAQGVELFETGRGGDVTYHGPGQLVGYPILDLRPDRCDVHRYVRDLEEALIRAVAAFGVTAGRMPGLTGAWVGEDKLAAIGVRIARWVTSHGFALNVATNLDHFNLIVPCGISGKGVTSLEKLTGRAPAMADVQAAVAQSFAAVFDRQLIGQAPVEPSGARQ